MAKAATVIPLDPGLVDQRVYFHQASWEDYDRLVALRGECATPRLTYLDGELEIMTPSTYHEGVKTKWARLVEAWSEEAGVDLEGIGSWTIKDKLKKLGLEPDECYFVGGPKRGATVPDIALEVIWTSGGLDKLEVYAGLGVPEVWVWKKGRITFHALRGDAYETMARSELLPQLDPVLIAALVDDDSSQAEAVRALRAAMRAAREPA
jgi:Uma2 family endonuclease